MSDNSYESLETDHDFFVELLTKHKVLFGNEKSPQINSKKIAAAQALVKEYNNVTKHKLNVRQVFRKISNLKTRIKSKNLRNLTRKRKLPFTEREQMFLDAWVGNDTKLLPKKKPKEIYDKDDNTKPIIDQDITASDQMTAIAFIRSLKNIVLPVEPPENGREPPITVTNVIGTPAVIGPDATKSPSIILPEVGIPPDVGNADAFTIKAKSVITPDVITVSTTDDVADPLDATVKIEADDYEMQDNSKIPSSSYFVEKDNSQTKTPFADEETDMYNSMSLDDLKRMALIAQIKNLNEQRAAARSKIELNNYKLRLLQQNNVINKSD